MANVPYSDRFTPELISSEGEYYILRLVPGAMKSNYSKIEATISKEFYYPVQLDYFDARGKKIKVAVYKQEKTGKYWTAAEIEMTDLEKAHSTRIIVADMKFDQGLPDEMFTVEKMNPSPRKPASTSAAPAEVK
jgi:outer membrane lipoprotein-sorting protein